MKSFFTTVSMTLLILVLLINGHALAQTDTPPQSCDKVLDITDTDSQATPLTLGANESLCLDSQQVEVGS